MIPMFDMIETFIETFIGERFKFRPFMLQFVTCNLYLGNCAFIFVK